MPSEVSPVLTLTALDSTYYLHPVAPWGYGSFPPADAAHPQLDYIVTSPEGCPHVCRSWWHACYFAGERHLYHLQAMTELQPLVQRSGLLLQAHRAQKKTRFQEFQLIDTCINIPFFAQTGCWPSHGRSTLVESSTFFGAISTLCGRRWMPPYKLPRRPLNFILAF